MAIELHDWILSINRVRGSVAGDGGLWLCGANNDGDMINYNPENEKPVFFDPTTSIIQVANGNKYIIKKKTICKALDLHKISDAILKRLPRN